MERITKADLAMTIDPWRDGYTPLPTHDAILALINGDHPDQEGLDPATAEFTIMLLQDGMLACARKPDNTLVFQPTVRAYVIAGILN